MSLNIDMAPLKAKDPNTFFYGTKAVRIQKHWRGFRARKALKKIKAKCAPQTSARQLYKETKTFLELLPVALTLTWFDQLSLEQQDGIICWALGENDKECIEHFYHTAHFVETWNRYPVHPIKYYEEDPENEAVKVCRKYVDKFKEVRRCIDNKEDLNNVYEKEYDSKLLLLKGNVLVNFVDYACMTERWKAVEQLLETGAQPRAGSISVLASSGGEKSYAYMMKGAEKWA